MFSSRGETDSSSDRQISETQVLQEDRNKEILPVTYRNNKKAWMTSVLFAEWLDKLNNSMIRQKRKIIMLVDNCGAHPKLVRSNVRLVFLPPNTTSRLQPCDAGIIQTVKLHYRKRFMRHILSEMDEVDTPLDLVKSVTIRDAICWLDMAWCEGLKESTIMKCFRMCGYETPLDQPAPSTSEAPNDIVTDIDPIAQDPATELGPRYTSVMDGVSWKDFGDCDREIITSAEDVEEPAAAAVPVEHVEKADSDEEDDQPPPIPIISSKTARFHVTDLLDFAFSVDNPAMVKAVRDLEAVMQDYKLQQTSQAPQKLIMDFFGKR